MNKNLVEMLDEATFLKDLKSDFFPLSESSMSRIISKYFDIGFIIISASRDCETIKGSLCDEEELLKQIKINRLNDKQLKSDLRQSKFGYLPVFGGFKEKNPETGELVDTPMPELSYIITSKTHKDTDNNKLKQLGLKLIKKYNQDSFLYKPPNSLDQNAYWIDQSGKIDMTFEGPVEPDDLTQQFYTQLRKGTKRRFTFTEGMIFWIPLPPAGVDIARRRYGEQFYRFK